MSPLNLSLTVQERGVLEQLLAAADPVTMAEVGRQCGLTQAQVRFALRTVELWLSERGAVLKRTPRVGLKIDVSSARRQTLAEELRRLGPTGLTMSPRERSALMLLRLLTAQGPVPEAALTRELGVSRSCFFRDLEQSRGWLAERGLEVQSRRRGGLSVTGEEGPWRDAVVELLRSFLSQTKLVALCLGGGAGAACERRGSLLEAAASEFARRLDLKRAEERLSLVERALGGVFPDRARAGLVLHLALAEQRQCAGRPIGPEREGVRADTMQERLAGEALEQAVGSVLAVAEVSHLAKHVTSALAEGLLARAGPRPHLAAAQSTPASAERDLALVLTRESARYLNARLFRDQELIDCLTLELAAAGTYEGANAAAASVPGGGPLFGFVRRVLGPVLAARGRALTPALAMALGAHIETALERQGRIGSQRRVWVVCGAGVATARNLVTRLNLYLPQLEILGLASAFELARQPGLIAGADAVISTIPLEWLESVPVLRVSPLLTSDDVALLRATLSLEESGRRTETTRPATELVGLPYLLAADTMQLGADVASWEQVVDRAGALLLAAGAVWPSYVEAMKDMIRLYGPYVVVAPGAALLHAGPDMGSKRLRFGLVVLREPVAFGHETNDPVSVALAFSAIDHATHVRAVGQAISLLANGDALREIRAARTVESALAAVKKWSAG